MGLKSSAWFTGEAVVQTLHRPSLREIETTRRRTLLMAASAWVCTLLVSQPSHHPPKIMFNDFSAWMTKAIDAAQFDTTMTD